MFNNSIFETWLDKKSSELILRLDQEKLSSEDMMILVLKAQSNHFEHLDSDLRNDMKELNSSLQRDMQNILRQMDKRFEQVDKRFEQVDKRFESVDKRFEHVYSFMKWQTGLGFAMLAGIYIKLFMG